MNDPAARPFPQDQRRSVLIRKATWTDRAALTRLAELDSAEIPVAPILLAFVHRDLRAALSLRDGAIVADPFHRTAEVVELLTLHAEQLLRPGRSPR
jgi:hypothetical protein